MKTIQQKVLDEVKQVAAQYNCELVEIPHNIEKHTRVLLMDKREFRSRCSLHLAFESSSFNYHILDEKGSGIKEGLIYYSEVKKFNEMLALLQKRLTDTNPQT